MQKTLEQLKAELTAQDFESVAQMPAAMPERVKEPYTMKQADGGILLIDASFPSNGRHVSIVERWVQQ